MRKKVICAWIGTFESEEELRDNYVKVHYSDDDEVSEFGKDTGLSFDEDFIESWWFEKLSLEDFIENKDCLLDYEYFFDELVEELKSRDLTNRNSITFLFGEEGSSINEMLFEYDGMQTNGKQIEFVFKKEYEVS